METTVLYIGWAIVAGALFLTCGWVWYYALFWWFNAIKNTAAMSKFVRMYVISMHRKRRREKLQYIKDVLLIARRNKYSARHAVAPAPTIEGMKMDIRHCKKCEDANDPVKLRAEIDRLRAEVAELLHEQAVLRDPVSLHANLLRGIPATLTKEQLLHLAGCTDYDALKKDSERLSFIEAQGSPGIGWIARHSFTGRGYRLHQDPSFNTATAREAIYAAIDAALAKDSSHE